LHRSRLHLPVGLAAEATAVAGGPDPAERNLRLVGDRMDTDIG